jgi:hypothetical protein
MRFGILSLIGAIVLFLALGGAYGAAVFFGVLGLLFFIAPKLSRPKKLPEVNDNL